MICDLESLIAPESTATFRDRFTQKTRWHIRSGDPAQAAALLPWRTLNHVIESNTMPVDNVRVVRAGHPVHPSLYRIGGEHGLKPDAVQDLLHQGATLVLSGIDRVEPSIGRLTASIERELSTMVSCNAYVTMGAGGAFRAHYDAHDVLVLQVHGRKRWQSFGTPIPFPTEPSPPTIADGRDVEWEDTLEPGHVLYLPRGEVHVASLVGDRSVHLTIGLTSRHGLDFLGALRHRAADDELFRRDLPVAGGEPALARHEAALKAALHALIDRTSLGEYLAHENAARALRPIASLGANVVRRETVIAPTVRRRVELHVDLEGERAVLVGGRSCRLSVAARRVLDFLLRHGDSDFGAIAAAMSRTMPESEAGDAVTDLARLGLAAIRD